MFKAIKDNKIISINEIANFPCMEIGINIDEVIEDTEHTVADFVHVNGEFVLTSDDKAIQQFNQERISELKQLLSDSDYKGQKYLDGEYTNEEWQEIVSQRKAWREEIRKLEK